MAPTSWRNPPVPALTVSEPALEIGPLIEVWLPQAAAVSSSAPADPTATVDALVRIAFAVQVDVILSVAPPLTVRE